MTLSESAWSATESQPSAGGKNARRKAVEPKQVFARSRVGNGKELLAGIDKRSGDYREYSDIVADLIEHLGSDPSVVESAIAEEAAGLIFWCRKARLALLTGGEFNVTAYTTATNALRRLLVDLGQEKRLKSVVPTLSEYVRSGPSPTVEDAAHD